MYKDMTPLMSAARTSSTELVRLLLIEKNADPNIINSQDMTALDYALKTDNIEIINMLSKVAKERDKTLKLLAQSHIELIGEIENRVKKMKRENQKQLMVYSSFYGNEYLLKYLLQKKKPLRVDMSLILKNCIMSDNPQACTVVLFYREKECDDVISNDEDAILDLAVQRGNRKIIQLLGIDGIERKNKHKILQSVPKSCEFSYINVMDKIVPLVLKAENCNNGFNSRYISYGKLIEELHVPEVHYDTKCNHECQQKEKCSRMRDVKILLQEIMDKMTEKVSIFKGVQIIFVGSTKEHN